MINTMHQSTTHENDPHSSLPPVPVPIKSNWQYFLDFFVVLVLTLSFAFSIICYNIAIQIHSQEYMQCGRDSYIYTYWLYRISDITLLLLILPLSRGISETGRKNAYNTPFFFLSICYFICGLSLFLIAKQEGVQKKEDCDTNLAFSIVLAFILIVVQILRAQMNVAIHSIATVDYR